jgi:putative MATE family efflux protein
MLTAQYWGRQDAASIETLMGIALKLSCTVGALFSAAAFFFPALLMRIFTNDDALVTAGASYLRFVSISYVLMAVSQVYQAILKSIEKVSIVTVITTCALVLNIFLNAVFIFGLFGAPRMGIRGVALATSLSRAVELLFCLAVSSGIKNISFTFPVIFRRNSFLLRDFVHYSLPALGNEFIWGAAFAMYSVILGHLGADIVAANSVVTVVRNLASVLCFGMAYGGAILIGKEMGTNNFAKAKRDAARLCKSTAVAGVFAGITMLLIKPLMFGMATLSGTARQYLDMLLYINCFSVIGAAVNTVIICGIFRAGGDARFGFLCDCIIMWLISVPLGLLSAFVFRLPPVAVYFILYLDEFEKMPFVIHHYRSGTWIKNITRDFAVAHS